MMNVEKLAVKVNLSLEQAYTDNVDWSILSGPRFTPGEIKLFNQAKKDRIAQLRKTWEKLWRSVVDESTGLAVLALHEPNEYGSCGGDHGREEGSEWPCRTVEVVADVYGFDLGQETL